jgi:hypothetical protein
MRIPADAIIPEEKITRYLLVPKASGDKSKYLGRGGFNMANTAALESEIRRLTAQTDAIIDRAKEHGIYCNVTGSLTGPTGTSLSVKLIWLKRLDGVFSFVTLVPETGS